MKALTAIIILVITMIESLYGFYNFLRFEGVPDVNDKTCHDSAIVFTQSFLGYKELGVTLCSARCLGSSNCTSIFYNSETAACVGCSGIYDASSPLLNLEGTKYLFRIIKFYNEICEMGDECIEPNQECFADMCICSPGYSYNPSNNTCVTECETYGITFQKYPRRRISGDNMYSKSPMTLTECFQECINSNALCVSVDYSSTNNRCNVQNVTVLTTATYLQVKEEYDFYARDCA